jgi:hypothetical protein
MDAEQDLGQPEAGAGIVHRHPMAQREPELHPPAEAKSLDGRDRRERQGLDAIEDRMPELYQRERRLRVRDGRDLPDIRPGDEAVRLHREQDDTRGWARRQLVEDRAELPQDLRRQHVGRRSGLVEVQPGDAGIIALDPPVLVGPVLFF